MINNNLKVDYLFDLTHTDIGELILNYEYVWQVIPNIKDIILKYSLTLDKINFIEIKKNVFVHRNTKISRSAYINEFCIIGEGCEIRHSSFIRGNAIIGKNCVIGNSTEIKNSILFDEVKVPHFNYVGDSILGYRSHLGAGAIISNVKSDNSDIVIKSEDNVIETHLKKLGAVLGDCVEIGCNSVLNPGTVVGKNTTVYPLSCVRGVIKENCIYKSYGKVIEKK